MSALRLLGVVVLLAGLGAAASGQDKKPGNEEKIVGLWETVKTDTGTMPVGSRMEFQEGGKAMYTQKKAESDREVIVTGKYLVEGDKLTLTFKIGTEERKQTLTIKNLTATDLVLADDKNKSAELKRKK
jgi:uncharacterized protein (TIGR03066 family)